MPVLAISLEAVAYAHGPTPIFEGLDLVLAPGWTGLVGPNGAGKTTLLRLIAGELRPDSGSLRLTPRDARVAWLVQVLDHPTPAIAAFAEDDARDAVRRRAELELAPRDLARWPSLSPGERRRWQLGAALDAAPDVLLLDEPEGHLDAGGRALLVRALRSFGGIGVLVAHDRALLDAVTTTTVELRGGRARTFPARGARPRPPGRPSARPPSRAARC
ncbi:MAG: ATP-binding cassette domain-containing protein [Myxococcota bacterium]